MGTIYLDMCCLKRPFDDQRQSRVRREARAVAQLLERVESGALTAVRSPALLLENARNPRDDRRRAAAVWLAGLGGEVALDRGVESRARLLAGLGFGPLDALHLAFAEAAGADWLATCDDELLGLARRHAAQLSVHVVNPCELSEGGSA